MRTVNDEVFFDLMFEGFLANMLMRGTTWVVEVHSTRAVDGYPSGSVNTERAGLTINIHSGLSDMERHTLSGGIEARRTKTVGRAFIDETCALADALPKELPKAPNVLLIKYLSSTAFEAELSALKHLCETNIGQPIIAVTSHVSEGAKLPRLETLLKNRVQACIITTDAGGQRCLGRLCDELTAQWPK